MFLLTCLYEFDLVFQYKKPRSWELSKYFLAIWEGLYIDTRNNDKHKKKLTMIHRSAMFSMHVLWLKSTKIFIALWMSGQCKNIYFLL